MGVMTGPTSLLRLKRNHMYKGLAHGTCSIYGAVTASPTRTHVIHSFNNYLLSDYYVPGTVLATRDTAMTKTGFGVFSLVEINTINKYVEFMISDGD